MDILIDLDRFKLINLVEYSLQGVLVQDFLMTVW